MEIPSAEHVPFGRAIQPEALSERLQAYHQGLEFLCDNSPGGEKVVEAWSVARQMTLSGSTEIPAIKSMVVNFVAHRPEMDAEQLVQLDWRVDQYLFGQQESSDYPNGFEDPEKWYAAMVGFMGDVRNVFNANYMRRWQSVQTNDPRRAAGLLLAGKLFEDRWSEQGADILDLGCSVGLIPIQLKTHLLEGHQPRIEDKDLQGNNVDPAVKRALAKLFAGRVAINKYWGIDIVDHDQATSGWAIPGCQYPSEYGNKVLQAEFAKLTSIKRQELTAMGLHFFPADFTNSKHMAEFREEVEGWRPTILTSQTTWYQMADKKKRHLLDKSNISNRQLLDPENGIEVRQEYAVPQTKNPHQVNLTPVYGDKSRYNLLIWDQSNPIGYQTYLRWDGGRLNSCRIGATLIQRLKDTGLIDAC